MPSAASFSYTGTYVGLFALYLLAVVAVTSALVVVDSPRAVYSALVVIVCFGAMAGLFFQPGADPISAVQVTVYASTIMVLFLSS